MMSRVAVLAPCAAVLLSAANGMTVGTVQSSSAEGRPVSKVITLLKDMHKQLEAEQAQDEEIYDKLACWCTTNDKDKTASIKAAEAKISFLKNKIEELSAMSARLAAEIENLEKEVAANEEALATATALREKQLADFNGEEKELLESISALKAAVEALKEHQNKKGEEVAFLQTSHMTGVAATLQRELGVHASLLEGVLSPAQVRATTAFVQSPQDFFDAAPVGANSYAPQSGQIFGVLTQMLETFEANLAAAQKQEQENQKDFEALRTAKKAEIAAGKAQIQQKGTEKADTDEKNAQAKIDLDETENSLSADEKFLRMLKEKCSLTDKDWNERQKTRQLEIQAVSEAMGVLTADDAHDTFTRTLDNVNLLQTARTSELKQRRDAASQVLARVAAKSHNPRLVTLAYRVKLDAFTRVKKAIDDLIAEMLQEKADEIKQKDFCVDEFNTNQLQTEDKEREKKDLEATIADLEATIAKLTQEIETLKSEIGEMQVQLKRAGEDREQQNKEFQMVVTDQRMTQRLLSKALAHLANFYGEHKAPVLAQQEPVGPPPPPGFEKYENNAASGGVMSLIQEIITDAKAMEKEAIRAEQDAEAAYAGFVTETNNSIETKARAIVTKSAAKAKAEAELVDAKKARASVVEELEELATYNAQLHTSCDYTLKNFDLRQAARDEEIEALQQAKAILSGAKFQAFLQHA